jgi:cyanophycinase
MAASIAKGTALADRGLPRRDPPSPSMPLPATSAAPAPPDAAPGHLVIIGGGEDRSQDMRVLRRFVALTHAAEPRVVVLTAASREQDAVAEIYHHAFGLLGAQPTVFAMHTRQDAADPQVIEHLLQADGVFMTGGDQRKLLAIIGGTRTAAAMHRIYRERGACIGGTSAGASAMSEHMLAEGFVDPHPRKGAVDLAAGLGFVPRAIVDQHFSQRQRLGRLLTVVAQNPYLLGVGIDEDTALVIERGRGLEVVGHGAVTLVDGREMQSDFLELYERDFIQLHNVRLHLLPDGARHGMQEGAAPDSGPMPQRLREAVAILCSGEYPA